MPAPTPRMIWAPDTGRTLSVPLSAVIGRVSQPQPGRRCSGGRLGRLRRGQQALADLTQGDGQRLLLDPGLDQRADVLQQALAELGVVSVDLPRPLGRHDDQAVLAVYDPEQVVNGRVGDALRGGIRHYVPSVEENY